MFHAFTLRPLLKILLLASGLLLPAMGQQPAPAPQQEEEKKQLRLVCISCLENDQEVILASQNDKGEWMELGAVKIRSSFITGWLPARAGALHLAVRDGAGLKSICRFKYPDNARHALVVLIADPARNEYKADVIDPQKQKFAKGSVLVVNFTSLPGMVVLGTRKVMVNSGQRVVAEPALEANGMYRMLVAYMGEDKKPVPCYDRYIPGNPDSRDFMFLFPDPKRGLKVFSLPMFGDLE